MNLANALWGAPRIHEELLKLGIEVAQSSCQIYDDHTSGIAAVDFLIVSTVGFKLLVVLVSRANIQMLPMRAIPEFRLNPAPSSK